MPTTTRSLLALTLSMMLTAACAEATDDDLGAGADNLGAPIPDELARDGGFWQARVSGADCAKAQLVTAGYDLAVGDVLETQLGAQAASYLGRCKITATYVVPAGMRVDFARGSTTAGKVGDGATARATLRVSGGGLALARTSPIDSPSFQVDMVEQDGPIYTASCARTRPTVLTLTATVELDVRRGSAREAIAKIDAADLSVSVAPCQ
jgi:hypothetical protein